MKNILIATLSALVMQTNGINKSWTWWDHNIPDDGVKEVTLCQYFNANQLSNGPREGIYCEGINFERYAQKYDVFSGDSSRKCCEDIKKNSNYKIESEYKWVYINYGRWSAEKMGIFPMYPSA